MHLSLFIAVNSSLIIFCTDFMMDNETIMIIFVVLILIQLQVTSS